MRHKKKKFMFPFLLVCLIIIGMSVSAEEPERSSYLESGQTANDKSMFTFHSGVGFSSDDENLVEVAGAGTQKRLFTSNTITDAVSSELNPPQKWTLALNGHMLTVSYQDTTVDSGCYWQVRVCNYGDFFSPRFEPISTISKKVISIDLSSLKDGKYQVYVMRGDESGSTSLKELRHYTMTVTGGIPGFSSANANWEQSAYNEIVSTVKPEWYNHVPAGYYTDEYNYHEKLSEIIATAKKVTSGASGNEAKLLKIHNWICSNISYDEDAAAKGYVSSQKHNNPFYVYKYKRGVCGGYARLMQIMLTSVRVPCIYIEGYGGEGESAGTALSTTNHAWNLVWVNNSWRYVDVTWDCRNKYEAGKIARDNCVYAYYGSPLYFFSDDHCTHKYSRRHLYVKKIFLYKSPKKTFTKGSSFSTGNGQIMITFSDGSTAVENLTASMCSGYNKNSYGSQTIKVSYLGGKLTYTVNVVPKKGSTHTVQGISYRITKASASKGTVVVSCVSNKKEITIPKTVKIKGYSFKVTGIGTNAFKRCTKLKRLTIETLTLKTVQKNALYGIRQSIKIYVPASKCISYKKLLQNKGQTGKTSIKKIQRGTARCRSSLYYINLNPNIPAIIEIINTR